MHANTIGRLAAILLGVIAAAAVAEENPAGAPRASHSTDEVFPPWQHGANNDALDRGLEFTIPQIDDLADFHGDISDPKLVLYVGGNYFFAMAPLVQAFEKEHPEYQGHLYWETIPPGLLVKQLEANGVITSGNMTWRAKADVYLAGLRAVNKLIDEGLLEGPAVSYVTNTLTIMVAKDNPHHITGLADLADPNLRLAMPNPEFEGIARQIEASLKKVGGDALAKAVYETKVHDGTTTLTHIHHRQTPLFVMQGVADAGVTWQSEALFQEQVGHAISHVDIPAAANTTAIYAGAMVKGAAHRDAAKAWLEFIHSPKALAIFSRYGFLPYRASGQ